MEPIYQYVKHKNGLIILLLTRFSPPLYLPKFRASSLLFQRKWHQTNKPLALENDIRYKSFKWL
jgi:hypothetical protein